MSKSANKMSVLQLTILTAVNMMGSGIIMLPSKLAQVGALSIVSWLVTAVGSMALAYVFAKCGMYSKKGGGMGGYAEYSFGKAGNFLANYTYGVSLIFANTAIAISAVGYALGFLGTTLDPVMTCAATVFTLWLATVLNFGGAKYTGQVSSVTVWGVIIPCIGLAIVGWFWFSPSLYSANWNIHNLGFGEAAINAITMTLWAFLGMESACANADAVDNPETNVPKPFSVVHSSQQPATSFLPTSFSVSSRQKNWLPAPLRSVSYLLRCLDRPSAVSSWVSWFSPASVLSLDGSSPLPMYSKQVLTKATSRHS